MRRLRRLAVDRLQGTQHVGLDAEARGCQREPGEDPDRDIRTGKCTLELEVGSDSLDEPRDVYLEPLALDVEQVHTLAGEAPCGAPRPTNHIAIKDPM